METYDLSMHSGSNVADFSYVEQMRYFQYLQEQMIQENELNAYISECLCLSEGTSIKELSALNEAISDKASNAWNKILDFLRRMWGKFTHTFGNLFNSNREYLSKYKDIILNKPIKAFQDVNMNDCEEAIKRMFEVKLSPIDNARLERLPENDKETTGAGNKLDKFRTTIVQDWKDGNPSNNRDQKDFVGWLSDYFKATDKQLRNKPASSFNMKDLYDFCYDGAENGPLYKQIERERKLIESDASQFEKELKELKVDKAPGAGVIKNTVPKAGATPPGKADATPPGKAGGETPSTTPPAEVDHNSAVMFSRVYNTYISEADLNKSSDASGETKSQEDNSNTAERAYTNRNDATEKQLDDKNREGRVKDAAAQKETIEFKAKTYITLATNICTAKLNGLSFVYGEYMQIIKAHVSSYVGNENKGETRATQTGTNYNQQAGNTQQQQSQDNQQQQSRQNPPQ